VNWLLAAPSIFVLLAVVVLFPYDALKGVRRNIRRRSGRVSLRRTRRELRHLARFLGMAVLVPLAALGMVQVALLAHHHLLGPAHGLAAVYGTHHPEVALSAPDIDGWTAAYEEARAAGEPVYGRLHTIGEALIFNWPLYPVYVVLTFAALIYFFASRYPRLARSYSAGVRKRGRAYRGGAGVVPG
jgi:hypothetical protein